MDETDVESSFLDVGQDKVAALGRKGGAGEQVGFFGIGVLSVFLVAKCLTVSTRKAGSDEGIVLEIADLESQFGATRSNGLQIGTTIHVELKEGVNFSVENVPTVVQAYARHVEGIKVENVDTSEISSTKDVWEINGLEAVAEIGGMPALRNGHLGFVPALFRNEGALSNRLTLCNGGFLVEMQALDFIPIQTLGIAGEIDVHPRRLNIAMSREKFQRDGAWNELGKELLNWSARLISKELEEGMLRRSSGLDSEDIKRAIMLWLHFIPQNPPFKELHSALETRLLMTVPFEVVERAPTSLKSLADSVPPTRRLYYRRKGAATQRRQQSNDSGFPIQWHEEIRDSVRIHALRANGYQVLNAQQIAVSVQNASGVSNQLIDEIPLINRCLAIQELQRVVCDDSASVVRIEAVLALCRIGGEEAAAALSRCKEQHPKDAYIWSAVEVSSVAN
jgi:hypothetical protein